MIFLRTLVTIAVASSLGVANAGLPAQTRRLISPKVLANAKRYSDSLRRIDELLKQCGEGVFVGTKSREKNRCSYSVKLDELFFQGDLFRTGLRQEANWAYKDGVTWFRPAVFRDPPERFDLRDFMRKGLPEIRKQSCGDCWAWATHHGLEISRAVHDGLATDLSVQTVLSCSGEGSCFGGYMSAVDFLKHGLPEEASFPYAARSGRCRYSSADIAEGWEGKVIDTPYIGESLRYSLAKQQQDGTFREGTKVAEIMAAMMQWQAPIVVTVKAYDISGPGIYDSCSSINSGGNHMVNIVGWDTVNGERIAHVWNSWGKSHGENGVSRIRWECGEGRLNRGLGVSAKVVQYRPPCVPPNARQTYLREIQLGGTVEIGAENASGVECRWAPTEGLADPNSCLTRASPTRTIEYHLTASNACGSSSSMTLVDVWPASDRIKSLRLVQTLFGEIRR